MDYRIAIATYNRVEGLGKKTLSTLNTHNISKDIIDIFVADKSQYDKYKQVYPEYNIIIGKLGLKSVRNFIFQEYYPEGQKVVSMDDDIEKIRMKNPRGWEASCWADDELDLKMELEKAFEECEKSGRNLWGLYPCENHFFMKNVITYDYRFCGGWCWGCINKRDNMILTTGNENCIEDFERSIRHYIADGGVVRLNYLHAKQKYGNPDGGIGSLESRERDYHIQEIQKEFPNLSKVQIKRQGGKEGFKQLVLKDLRDK
tara:strand:- start:58 stop:834 length:777 start_codon:yes stop_codon:yes gene_type:complete